MKYVIKLERVVTKQVVIDAQSFCEALEKLRNDDTECEFEELENPDAYNGFAYVSFKSFTGEGNQRLICNIDDLSQYLGVPVHKIEKYLYQNTECGMAIEFDRKGITLVGHVECDCKCDVSPSATLTYPFTVKDFKNTVHELELEADAIWHDVNGYGEDGGLE